MEAPQPSGGAGAGTNRAAARSKQEATSPDLSIYSSCDFYLWCFKILPCSKRWSHEWTTCPFAHPGEKAKRRDPRTHKYDCEMCPAVVKGEQCELGAACPHSHHVFESWLHPQKFRTMLCKDGDSCHREVCFFAHGQEQLRVPTRDMPLGGPSRLRGANHDLQLQPQSSAAIAAAAVAAITRPPNAEGYVTPMGTGGTNRHVRFQFPLMHASGSVCSTAAASSNTSSLPVMSGSITSNLMGSTPTDMAGVVDAAASQPQWGACSIGFMPVASGSGMGLAWHDGPAASAHMQVNTGELYSSNLMNSGTVHNGATAPQADVGQLFSVVQQNRTLWRNPSAPEGALSEATSHFCMPGVGRTGSVPVNSSGALSDTLASLLLQQQLGQLTTSSEQGVHQNAARSGPLPQPFDAADAGSQLSMLQKLQAKMTLQDAAAAAGLNHIMSDASSMSTNLSFAHSISDTAAVTSGVSANWEPLHKGLSGSAGSSGCSPNPQGMLGGACLVPSSSSLLANASGAPEATDVNTELLSWLQTQRFVHEDAASADGVLLQQPAAPAPAAAVQIQDTSMLPNDATWALLNSVYGSTASNNRPQDVGYTSAPAAAKFVVGLPHNTASALGWLNDGLRQNQLASEYLSHLQQDMKGGGFLSAPHAMYSAADGGAVGATGDSNAGRSIDTASSYAALLRGVHTAEDGALVSFVDGKVAVQSASAAVWPANLPDNQQGAVANSQDMLLHGRTAAGGNRQLGWL